MWGKRRGHRQVIPRLGGRIAKHRLMGMLAMVGFAVPVIAYFWLIHRYGLNVIHWDQWNDVKIIGDLDSGKLTLGDLWALHNENRILFPNLIVLLLGKTTHFNIVIEEYLEWSAPARVDWSVGGDSPASGWNHPVGLLLPRGDPHAFVRSISEHDLGISNGLVSRSPDGGDHPCDTGPAHSDLVVDGAGHRLRHRRQLFVFQGLIIWPVGLLLMYYRCRPRATMVCWVAAAVVTTVLYFIHDSNSQDYLDYLAHHPVAGMEFYFISIGDVVGVIREWCQRCRHCRSSSWDRHLSDVNLGTGDVLLGT